MDIERRYFKCEIRADDKDAGIVGDAAVFNSLSEDLGGFRETILPGAFADAIKADDIRALFNHDSNLILGRNQAGTLHLSENSIGLRYKIDPPNTTYANDLRESIKRGDVDQSSFGFQVPEGGDSWQQPENENELPIRILHRVKLFDVSPVTFPAYQATSVAVRAIDKAKQLSEAGQDAGEDIEHTEETSAGVGLLRAKLNLLKMK